MADSEKSTSGSVQGWVQWRDNPGERPTFRYGTLTWRDSVIESFAEQSVAASSSMVEQRATDDSDSQLFIVPGFVDLHSHLAIAQGPQSSDVIRAHAWEEIRAGVLAVREPGSPVKVSPGELPFGRPIVISAGRHIALEKRYNRGLAIELPADPTEGEVPVRASLLADEVQRQASASDGWVKLVGDWIDRSEGASSDLRPLWSREELLAAIDAAHEVGAKVAVHTFGRDIIDDLLDAGVDSIEHGTGMSATQMRRAAKQGVVVVPTLIQVLKFPEFASSATRYPRYAQTMTDLYDGREKWFADLLSSGVTILPGSDAGGYQVHGALLDELEQWVAWGMEPEDVLASATWKARDFLGLDCLQVGAPADAVVFTEDPCRVPQVWRHPQAVAANGRRVVPATNRLN